MTQVTARISGSPSGRISSRSASSSPTSKWSHFITVRRFVDEEVVPVVGPYWERAEICWPLVKRLPELGIVGEDIKGYGCAGMSPMACGLVTMELHRGDGSLGVFSACTRAWPCCRSRCAARRSRRRAGCLTWPG
jgi:Acyl-CoA dehydrogenases